MYSINPTTTLNIFILAADTACGFPRAVMYCRPATAKTPVITTPIPATKNNIAERIICIIKLSEEELVPQALSVVLVELFNTPLPRFTHFSPSVMTAEAASTQLTSSGVVILPSGKGCSSTSCVSQLSLAIVVVEPGAVVVDAPAAVVVVVLLLQASAVPVQ
jgi:hypothetical protein